MHPLATLIIEPYYCLTLLDDIYHGDISLLDLPGGQLLVCFNQAPTVVESRFDRWLSKTDSWRRNKDSFVSLLRKNLMWSSWKMVLFSTRGMLLSPDVVADHPCNKYHVLKRRVLNHWLFIYYRSTQIRRWYPPQIKPSPPTSQTEHCGTFIFGMDSHHEYNS